MKLLHGEKISDEAFQWVLLHLKKGQEQTFIGAHRGGQCALKLGTGKLYEKGFEFGAYYCSVCDTQYGKGNFLDFKLHGIKLHRVCGACKERMGKS
jgi:hypothetical protein